MQIKLLLTNGKHAVFNLPDDTATTIQQLKSQITSNWPKEWTDEPLLTIDEIRILYRGRFLADNVELQPNDGAAGGTSGEDKAGSSGGDKIKLPIAEVTTMHLVPKPVQANGNGGGSGSVGCKCNIL